jgi:hypothetical protein
VRDGHRVEAAPALGREANRVRAAVALDVAPLDQALGDELVGEARDIAARHHHPLRELAHPQPCRVALQLRHQVEARQRGREVRAQARADVALDQHRAGEKAQPQSQRVVVVVVYARFVVGV